MEHVTIDYGIDLGTTNSAICRMHHGVPEIFRSDSGLDTMPSCVSVKKGNVLKIGHSAYADLGKDKLRALKKRSAATTGSFIEFKRYMGTDFRFVNADNQWSPEDLSAQVLKTLCSFVQDDKVNAAVITVPAKFTVNQKDATMQAARLAGIAQVELLQEPIAASIAYGLTAEDKNGFWMVFDFGGGTLDVALVHSIDGIMQVFDTEGDNYLGGKNLDELVVSRLLLPQIASRYALNLADDESRMLFIDALKVEAEKIKNKLSYSDSETVYLEAGDWGEDEDGEEIEMEITVTRAEFEDVVRPLLQKAVDICKTLMLRNNLSYGKLSHLLPIGGPTYIPLLRKMLREQVTENLDTGINPMTAVATGAAIYASTIPVKINEEELDEDVIRLSVECETTTVEEHMFIPVIPKVPVDGLSVKMIRRNDHWESMPKFIGQQGNILEVDLIQNQPNVFRISALVNGDEVRCYPSEITIVQGMRAGVAILPYNIGIEVLKPQNHRRVFTSMTGLEKNRPIPVSGDVYGLKTMVQLRPGYAEDVVRIPVYQGDDNAEGRSAALYEYVSDVIVNGDDVISYIPAGSVVNVRLSVDRSEMMTVRVDFPESGQKVEKVMDTSRRQTAKDSDYLKAQILQAHFRINAMKYIFDDPKELMPLIESLSQIEHNLDSGAQHKQVEQHLKEILREVEELEDSSEWLREKRRLMKAFLDLQIAASKKKDPSVQQIMESFEVQVERVKLAENILEARSLCAQMGEYEYNLTKDERYRDTLIYYHTFFSRYKWKNPGRAQELVLQGKKMIDEDPNVSADILYPILIDIQNFISEDNETQDHNGASFNSSSSPHAGIDILSM